MLLLAFLAISAKTQDACSIERNPAIRVYVVEYAIYIKTDVQHNTSFAVNRDLMVTVDNAPTYLDLTITRTSRKTVIRSAHGLVFKSTKA